MGASADTLETFFYFKHVTCASHREEKKKNLWEKKEMVKKTKTNQEEAGNESNSCITSNTPSSKLHNIKNQAQSEYPTSKTIQHRGGSAEPAEPCPRSEAHHAPTLLFIFILCHASLLSLGYLLPKSNTALWVGGRPGGNTHSDFLPRQNRQNRGILWNLSARMFFRSHAFIFPFESETLTEAEAEALESFQTLVWRVPMTPVTSER